MIANCLHDLTAIGPGGLPVVALALLLAGLAGGLTHCAAMCAPFVIAQAGAATGGGGTLSRLAGAALLPYHAGRIVGYSALGALSGLAAGVLNQATGLRHVLAALLLAAAVLMALQALQRLPGRWRLAPARLLPAGLAEGLAARLTARMGRLLARPGAGRGFGLGLLLSGLPCGLLYAALAAAAATGSALAGAVAMLAFCLGTIPSLIGVAFLGRFFLRALGPRLQVLGAGLFALNAVVLAGAALRLAG
ncbi:urease accessory protein UreH domain-containing protein [Falsiroseomonas ponticola]|uniref:urease accessory protein UreH domain-containing protein n=1 Tax=Falsiroseomonas ponticola TaxID=2786951 RepID=UPI0019317B6B|nr:sulfite exporter TauE/SafE family protein [Roseomonas ponticola]